MSWLARQAGLRPGAPAVRAGENTFSYAELAEKAARGAAALAAAGVAPGDSAAVRLPNTWEHVVALHAVAWRGAVLVPIHPRSAPAEVAGLTEDSGACLLIASADDPVSGVDLPCPVLPVDRLADEASGTPGPSPAPPPGWACEPALQPDDALHSILHTTGTTGRPRPVPLTHGNHRASAEASAANLGVDPDDDWLCPLPLAHAGGLAVVLRSVLYGTCVTLVEGFDPEEVASLLRSGAVTHASLVPTMLRRLVALPPAPGGDPFGSRRSLRAGSPRPDTEPKADLGSSRLRAVLVGGGPLDPELAERALARGLPVLGTYGLTETASQVATVPPGEAGRKPGSAGPPLPGVEIEFRDATGHVLGPGETGEIHVRGPMVSAAATGARSASGGRPATAAGRLDSGGWLASGDLGRLDSDGWLATGDLGRLDADGWLWVAGRLDDLIVTGGENVAAAEVEAVLRAHPAVADCAVVGLPDPEWGRLVAAAVVPRGPEAPPAADALAAWCRERLAPFKVPKRWRIVDELPRTAAGKVARPELRGLFEEP